MCKYYSAVRYDPPLVWVAHWNSTGNKTLSNISELSC